PTGVLLCGASGQLAPLTPQRMLMRSKISRPPLSEVAQRCELAGFTLFETAYAPSLKMPRHGHAAAAFSLVLHGAYTEQHGKRTRACQPSTIVFHPPDEEQGVQT